MNPLLDKVHARGVGALTDEELLTVLVGDAQIAETLLQAVDHNLSTLLHYDLARLRMIGGLGIRRALHLVCAAETGKRIAEAEADTPIIIRHSDDVVRLFRPQLAQLSHEECWAVFLTSSNRIIERMRISKGGVQATVVDHRLIIKRALELLATQIILIHNHPSGAATSSQQDCWLTERVNQAAALFDIKLLDHIIISKEGDYSFRREGLLQ